MLGVVTTCIAASKPKVRELAVQIIFTYIKNKKHEVVQAALLKGMEHKCPHIIAACASVITQALRYGYILTDSCQDLVI
jgi:hypothetical protein